MTTCLSDLQNDYVRLSVWVTEWLRVCRNLDGVQNGYVRLSVWVTEWLRVCRNLDGLQNDYYVSVGFRTDYRMATCLSDLGWVME